VEDRYTELAGRLAEISDLGRARALLAWDERTGMPAGGAEARAEQLGTLARVRHQRLASDELGLLLDELRPWAEELPYDSLEASTVRVATREWTRAHRVPADLRAEITRAASLSEHSWVGARERSDFQSALPHLERLVDLKRRYIECFDGFEHPYDVLLYDFEPETTTAQVAPVLAQLRDGVVPLVERITEGGAAANGSCLHGEFPIDAQRRFCRELVGALPLPEAGWRLDDTTHPFASAISPRDVRLTTRYDPEYLGTAIWSVIHEAGHGIYESGMPDELRRGPLCGPPSLGLHESQSRLWENWVGRGEPFLSWLLPRLRAAFPDRFVQVDAEELYRAANRVERSLIRVEADEVTYNLHIAIRLELELAVFSDELALNDLPEAWNARYAEYLGVEPRDDAHGVLQDVHWYGGAFGYFPTYSLGNVIAAQLWDGAHAELGDLDERLAAGELGELRAWLDERLYRHGGKFTPAETVERAAGAPLDAAPLIAHLEAKFGAIYDL
jgi:carboxypeptidase Taq